VFSGALQEALTGEHSRGPGAVPSWSGASFLLLLGQDPPCEQLRDSFALLLSPTPAHDLLFPGPDLPSPVLCSGFRPCWFDGAPRCTLLEAQTLVLECLGLYSRKGLLGVLSADSSPLLDPGDKAWQTEEGSLCALEPPQQLGVPGLVLAAVQAGGCAWPACRCSLCRSWTLGFFCIYSLWFLLAICHLLWYGREPLSLVTVLGACVWGRRSVRLGG
jgi:hypothetical protein